MRWTHDVEGKAKQSNERVRTVEGPMDDTLSTTVVAYEPTKSTASVHSWMSLGWVIFLS